MAQCALGACMSAPDSSDDPKFGTTKYVARRGSLSSEHLRKLRRIGGGPPFIRVGRAVRYDISKFDAWMRSRTFTSGADESAKS